jgi:hypothetical protein
MTGVLFSVDTAMVDKALLLRWTFAAFDEPLSLLMAVHLLADVSDVVLV